MISAQFLQVAITVEPDKLGRTSACMVSFTLCLRSTPDRGLFITNTGIIFSLVGTSWHPVREGLSLSSHFRDAVTEVGRGWMTFFEETQLESRRESFLNPSSRLFRHSGPWASFISVTE